MAIFKNLDGTTKSAFKIGPKGVTLSVTGSTNAVKRLMANDKIILTGSLEEEKKLLTIPLSMLTSVVQNTDGSVTLYLKEWDANNFEWKEMTPVTLEIGKGNIKCPTGTEDGEFSLYDGQGGLKKSNLFRTDRLFKDEYDENGKAIPIENTEKYIPTAKAVVDYIGDISDILIERQKGRNKK